MYEFLRQLDSFVSNGINVNSDIVDNLFDMLKERVIGDNWSQGTFGGYSPSLDPFHVYLLDFPRKIT